MSYETNQVYQHTSLRFTRPKFPHQMTPTRTSYHTSVKRLVHDGSLSSDIVQQIPRANIYRWKAESKHKYQSFGITSFDSNHELACQLASHKTAMRIFAAYVRIIKTVVALAHSLPGFHKMVHENRKQIVELIHKVKSTLGLVKALQFFDISISTFRLWSLQSSTACFQSLINSCNRIFPNQLSHPQLLLLRELLLDPKFRFWPVASIAWYALRNNILALSLNTWYKYVHKLGLQRERPVSRRKKHAISIRATRPHQVWHADITMFVTHDQVKNYIYLVADNYSRKILSCLVADSVKAHHRKASINQAIETLEGKHSITLITDGGPENELADLSPLLVHKKALVDVHYSNSLIEAHNKILKYNYLYRMDIPDGQYLQNVLPGIIDDFNNRPHLSLEGLTPNEAEKKINLDRAQLRANIQQATAERKTYNKIHQCDHCRS